MKQIKHIIFFLLVLFANKSFSQNYPVQAFVQLTPPYSSYLPDYSDPFNNQLKVLLTLTDFAVPSYQVKLRFSIEGQGYSMQSVDLVNFAPITLTPGVPVEVSGSDLAPYLATQNLNISGLDVAQYEQTKILPEGPATICVEVIDFNSANQSVIGNPACGQSWFSLYEPPLLNTPFCGDEITPSNPQQIMFAWSPLHMASPNSGQTQYTFELFEIRPDGADPNQVVNSTLPIYTAITTNTFVNYGVVEPQLQIGMSYVWRIKAADASGRDLYTNNGYSAVCTFTYGNVASSILGDVSLELETTATTKRQGKAWWTPSGVIENYIVEVRKTGNPDFEWFPYETTASELLINNLEPETEYEARLKGTVGEAETDWSNISTFTTPAAVEYACNSDAQQGAPANFVPADFLQPGDIVQVGQFEMMVTAAEPAGPPGVFEGTGKITIPFMLLALNVEYDDLKVDELMIMRDGRVDAITEGVDAWSYTLLDHHIPGTVDSTSYTPGDTVVFFYFGDDVMSFELPEAGETVTVQDESNREFIIMPDGTVIISFIKDYSNDHLDATADYQVQFEKSSANVYGFDKKTYDPWTLYYEAIMLDDGTDYFVSYKSMGEETTDKVLAKVIANETVDSLFFLDTDDNNYPATKIDDTTWEIDLTSAKKKIKLYAYDDMGMKLGKLEIEVYKEETIDIVVVPVNGSTVADQQALTNYLDDTYKSVNYKFNVTIQADFQCTFDEDGNGLNSPDSEEMSLYSAEMKGLRDLYFDSIPDAEKNAMYFFVVPSFQEATTTGYMVRGKSLGFIKSGEPAKTYAHELGHGFKLHHSFPAVPKGQSNNLMDYANEENLIHEQWEKIRDFSFAFSFLDDVEDGSAIYDGGLFQAESLIGESSYNLQINIDGLVTPSGYAIVFANPNASSWIIKDIYLDQESGGVKAFTLNDVEYISVNISQDNGGFFFANYIKKTHWELIDDSYKNIETDHVSGNPIKSSFIYDYIQDHHESLLFYGPIDGPNYDILLSVYDEDNCSREIITMKSSDVELVASKPGQKFISNKWQHPLAGYRDPITLEELYSNSGFSGIFGDFVSQHNVTVGASFYYNPIACRYINILDNSGTGAFFLEKYTFNTTYQGLMGVDLQNIQNSEDTIAAALMLNIAEKWDEMDEVEYFYATRDHRFTEKYLNALEQFHSFNTEQSILTNTAVYLSVLETALENSKNLLAEIENSNDEDFIAQTIMESLFFHDLASLTLEQRLNLLEIICKDWMWEREEKSAMILLTTTPNNQVSDLLDGLLEERNIMSYMTGNQAYYKNIFTALYSRITGAENNLYVYTMYDLWVRSEKHSNPDNYDYTDKQILFNYKSEEILGFYNSNYNLSTDEQFSSIIIQRESDNIGSSGTILDPVFFTIINSISPNPNEAYEYDPFQPIAIINIDQDGEVSLPSNIVPAFLLYTFDRVNTNENVRFAGEIALDIIATFVGGAGIYTIASKGFNAFRKLSYFRKFMVGVKVVEFTSGTANIILKYTCADDNTYCQDIQEILMWVEIVSLSGDAIYGGILKYKAKQLLKNEAKMADLANDPNAAELMEVLTKCADDAVQGLASYPRIRSFLEDGRVLAHLNNSEMTAFVNILKSSDPDVLKIMDEFKNADEFAEMVRGYKDNPQAFIDAVKNVDTFNGSNGWLKFWKLTPKIENSLNEIRKLQNEEKLLNTGSTTDIQLASIHSYTVNGNFINIPFRYQASWFGLYNSRAVKHINEGLDELRKIPSRVVTETVYSGKAYSQADFNTKFIGKMNQVQTYEGYISSSKLESVAEGFVDLTKQWAGNGDKVAVISRIVPKNGVYIDDLSDWGKNLGPKNHPNPPNPKVQIQDEVLLNSGKLKQVSEPIPVMENGVHKTVGGLLLYYVDFIELL